MDMCAGIDRKTGKLVWEDNSVHDKILHGQWSSPAVGKIGDVVQVVIGQGDGYVRGYRSEDGQTGVGRQLGSRQDSARAVVVAGGGEDRRCSAGGDRAGRWICARV